MYRRQRRGTPPLVTLILVGMAAGVVFLVYDQLRNRATALQPSATPLPVATLVPATAAVIASTPLPTPTESGMMGAIVDSSLLIPSAGIYAPIIQVYLDGESWDVSQLGMNVGHLQGTAWLDSQPGNIALSAHIEMSDGRPGTFARLDEVQVGDLIILKESDAERRYTVTAVQNVAPDDLTPLYPSSSERVTLITCGSYNFLQDAYLDRVVVVAERVS